MAAKGGFSISDLQQGAKSLSSTPAESKNANDHHNKSSSSSEDRAAIEALEDVYNKHNGDIDAM